MHQLDLLIIVCLGLIGGLIYRIIQGHLADDLFRQRGELEAAQLRASLFMSKFLVLEQYIQEYWHTVPESEAEDLETLAHIRDGLNQMLDEVRRAIRSRNTERASALLARLNGEPAHIEGVCARYNLLKWQERTHKIILRMCQKLTIEASMAGKAQTSGNYRRTPTMLSLREISELFRETRTTRL